MAPDPQLEKAPRGSWAPQERTKALRQRHYSNDGKTTVYPADANGNVQRKKGKTVDLKKAVES